MHLTAYWAALATMYLLRLRNKILIAWLCFRYPHTATELREYCAGKITAAEFTRRLGIHVE